MKHGAKSEALSKRLGNNIGYCSDCEKKHEKGKHDKEEHSHKSHHKESEEMKGHSHESHHEGREEEINGDEE